MAKMKKKTATTRPDALGPNKFPKAVTAEDKAAVAVTCKYLGRVFYEGQTICYDGGEWRCSAEGWVETGTPC